MMFQTFPTYLLPSLPFTTASRRRKKSTSSSRSECSETSVPSLSTSPTSSASADASPSTSPPPPARAASHGFTGLLHAALQKHQNPPAAPKPQRLSCAQPNLLKCVTCATDIAFASQIISKCFTGRHGRAYLISPQAKTPEGTKARKSTKLVNTKTGRPVNRELSTGTHVVADVSCAICSAVLGWKYLDAKEQAQKYKIGKYLLETKRVVEFVSWEDGVEGLEEAEELAGDDMNRNDDDVVIFDDEDEDECEDLFMGTWDPSVAAGRRATRVNTRSTDASN